MGLIVYNIFNFLFKIGLTLVSPWNIKARLWVRGRRGLFQKIRSASAGWQGTEVVWMHCASLGEFEQGRPVLEQIKKLKPGANLVLSFFSSSGYEIRKDYQGADMVVYLPTDSYRNAKNFLDILQPSLVLWVKYEYWFYYLAELKKRKIPTLLISGVYKEHQLFFKWYGGIYRKMLPFFTHIFVQTAESKTLLSTLGVSDNVTVSGDTRFDRVIEIAEQFKPIPSIEAFCSGHDVIVAGSTWQDDEEELDHFANTHPEIRFIIAPHEIDAAHLKEIKKLFHHAVFFTEWEQLLQGNKPDQELQPNVLVIDNIGMLSKLYKYATIAYIGGGFGDEGVHNVLEAAVYGKPVLFGPVYDKFVEAEELVLCGGAFSVDKALDLEEVLNVLLRSTHEQTKAGELAKNYVYAKRGATAKIIDLIKAPAY